MTTSRRGSSVSQKSVSLVRYPVSSSPGIGGAAARAPVAMTARENSSVRPSTSTVVGLVKRASPR